jgi:alpha-D-ribose 1-methylphosphonate 5-triphosphate synthase subunit PhnH
MLTVSPPDALEARSNATFEALMWSMSRPGEPREMPEPGFLPIVEAMIDLECVAFADTAEVTRAIAVSGAELTADVALADHVFIEKVESGMSSVAHLRCGSALYPDDGATLVVKAGIGDGTQLRLSGPGIEATRDIAVALSPEFWAARQALCLYPQGFDLFVVDGRAVIGIPRSTEVEVL